MTEPTELQKLKRKLEQLYRLAKLGGPDVIIARHFVGSILPQMTRIIGTEVMADALKDALLRGIDVRLAKCVQCHKADGVMHEENGQRDWELCAKCRADFDRFCEAAEAEIGPGTLDNPSEPNPFEDEPDDKPTDRPYAIDDVRNTLRIRHHLAAAGIEMTPGEVAEIRVEVSRKLRTALRKAGYAVPDDDAGLREWLYRAFLPLRKACKAEIPGGVYRGAGLFPPPSEAFGCEACGHVRAPDQYAGVVQPAGFDGKRYPVCRTCLVPPCAHERLNEGVCRACGADCRGVPE